MAPLIREFRKYPDVFEMLVCVTGQHRQMLDPVLALFEIVPDIDLDIIRPDQDLSDITTSVLKGMQGMLQKAIPDLVLVQGDTTTSMAAALAAFYQRIPVAHVEAGLRTHHMHSPWPEEMNRSIIGRIATWHFAPTARAKQNLMDENVPEDRIYITGNTVIDALQWVIAGLKSSGEMIRQMDALLLREGYDIRRLGIHRRLILVTGHRRESFGEGFDNICHAIRDLSLAHPDVDFVYPVHLNPHVRKPVHEILGDRTASGNVFLLEPLDYLPFIYLMSNACLVLTDSGGIQEEAPALGKPVLVMRDTTERPEALEAGTARLVGTDRENIGKAVSNLLIDKNSYRAMSKAINPYGDGHASEHIVAFIRNLK